MYLVSSGGNHSLKLQVTIERDLFTLFIPVLYLMLVVSAISKEHKLQHSEV